MANGSTALRVALLIDADNASSQTLSAMLSIIAHYGDPIIKHAYGNWDGPELTQWKPLLPQHGIQAMHQFDYVKGKNATDMSMTIDAMDLMYQSPIDVFALASSDSDFTPLAFRLRAAGKRVVGMGKAEASVCFRQACHDFHKLQAQVNQSESFTPVKTASLVKQSTANPHLVRTLHQLIVKLADEAGRTELGALGKALRSYGYTPQDFGHSSLMKALSQLDGLLLMSNGSQVQVAIQSGFHA